MTPAGPKGTTAQKAAPGTKGQMGPKAGRREVVRAPRRAARPVATSPVAGDLDKQDSYARSLIASLMRAQMGVTLSTLLPAAAIVLAYPLLAVLAPSLGTDHVLGVPLSLVILGGAIYPPIVLLGLWYVRRTERVEQRFVELFRDRD
ncbi:MAG TPA: hypothetical protein VL984_12405 [Acidimicrobiales bacterium]|nr:hypothetical protein [Acidimicrobiales bacterium]